MDEYECLIHTQWDCKRHVILMPKCRCKKLHGELRKHLGEGIRDYIRNLETEDQRIDQMQTWN